jgi:hypothetical protein
VLTLCKFRRVLFTHKVRDVEDTSNSARVYAAVSLSGRCSSQSHEKSHIFTDVPTATWKYGRTDGWMDGWIHAKLLVDAYIYDSMYVYVHTNIHTHTHTHTHTIIPCTLAYIVYVYTTRWCEVYSGDMASVYLRTSLRP